MTARILLIFFIILLSCSKEEAKYEPKPRSDPYKLYEDAYQAFENGDYFYAQKKFSEAELNFTEILVLMHHLYGHLQDYMFKILMEMTLMLVKMLVLYLRI